jgi:hypothetical protein
MLIHASKSHQYEPEAGPRFVTVYDPKKRVHGECRSYTYIFEFWKAPGSEI